MKSLYRNLMIWCLTLSACIVLAQEDKEQSKIKIEISKEINGEKKTFKGEYENEEQMRSDPNYQEFAGEDQRINFFFNDEETNGFSFDWRDMDDIGQHFFHFNSDDESGFSFDFDEDSSFQSFHFGGNAIDISRLSEMNQVLSDHLQDLGIDLDGLISGLDNAKRGDKTIVIDLKRIAVEEVESNEFGKKGQINEKDQLALEDLSFYPNPTSNGKLKVKFKVPKEDELAIKVYNLDGQEVFNRYFERFGGTYIETIDLSNQQEGIYLLEISQASKKIVKKIVVK